MVQEEIHLQENTLFDLGVFDLDPKVKVTGGVAWYLPHHVTYAQGKFKLLLPKHYEEMRFQENTLFDLDLGVKVTRNIAQYS